MNLQQCQNTCFMCSMTLTKGNNDDNECDDDDDDDKNLQYYMGAYPSWSVQGADEVSSFFFFSFFSLSYSLFFTKHIVGLLFRNMHPSMTISFHSLVHTSFHNSFWRSHIYTYTRLQEVILSSKNIYNIKVKKNNPKNHFCWQQN